MTETALKPKPKTIALGIGGGGFYFESVCLLQRLSQSHDFIAIIPSDSTLLKAPILGKFPSCTEVFSVPAVTNFTLESSRFSKAAAFFQAFSRSYQIFKREKPVAVIVLGSSLAIPLFVAAKLQGIKTVFVESITRVSKPSQTALLTAHLRLADRAYVQWPDLLSQVPNAIYQGTIL